MKYYLYLLFHIFTDFTLVFRVLSFEMSSGPLNVIARSYFYKFCVLNLMQYCTKSLLLAIVFSGVATGNADMHAALIKRTNGWKVQSNHSFYKASYKLV